MNMTLLFNRTNKNEDDFLKASPAKPDGFWVGKRQKSVSHNLLQESFRTQKAMEERAAKILKGGEYTKVQYRLLDDGFSGAIHFKAAKRKAPKP